MCVMGGEGGIGAVRLDYSKHIFFFFRLNDNYQKIKVKR